MEKSAGLPSPRSAEKVLPGSVRSRTFRTSEVARILRVHPNTVRRYEEWKLFGPVPRTPSGYRVFSSKTVDSLKVIRNVFAFSIVPGEIHSTATELRTRARDGKFADLPEPAGRLASLVVREHETAMLAAAYVRAWIERRATGSPERYVSGREAAASLGVTKESLRTWERNGLIDIPRNPSNGYRVYGPEEMDRLLVIRSLRKAGFSQQAILRMFTRLSREGKRTDIIGALDTPTETEDLFCATNTWITTLETLLVKAERMKNLCRALAGKYASSGP